MANLGDRIAELLNPAPKLEHEDEDLGKPCIDDKYEGDYADIGTLSRSQLRIKNFQPLLDERYVGKKVSRKKLMEDSEESDDELQSKDIESDEDEVTSKESDSAGSEKPQQYTDDDGENTHESDAPEDKLMERSVSDDDSGNSEEESSDVDNETEDSMIAKFSSIDVDEEANKGKAVKAQLSLWDRLLENRIKLQKLLVISNKLPQNDNYKQFFDRGNDDFKELVNKGHKSIKLLLDLLIELQTELLWRNNSTNYIISNKDKSVKESSDEEIPSETEDEDANLKEEEKKTHHNLKRKLDTEEYPEFLAKRHRSFTSFRDGTIQKWNDKIRVSSGKFNQNSFSAFDQSALKQIEQIMSDKPRLIKRTQLKRSTYRVLGKTEECREASDDKGKEDLPSQNDRLKEYDAEIFDDDDFYHQLLRELIEKKTTDVNDPISLSKQWLEIQKFRVKMKKKVDTKASKGRKVRYDVIPKLVNFMASDHNTAAADETINELCRSLFKESQQPIVYT